MFKIEELDHFVSAEAQRQDDRPEPVVLINIFHVTAGDVDVSIVAWANFIRRLKNQRGFIAAQLYRCTAGSGTVINHAVWESTAHYRSVFENPEFKQGLPAFPESVLAKPHPLSKGCGPRRVRRPRPPPSAMGFNSILNASEVASRGVCELSGRILV